MDKIEIEGSEYVAATWLAKERGVPVQTLYMAISAGKLKSKNILGRVMIPLADAEAWDRTPGRGRPRRPPLPAGPPEEGSEPK